MPAPEPALLPSVGLVLTLLLSTGCARSPGQGPTALPAVGKVQITSQPQAGGPIGRPRAVRAATRVVRHYYGVLDGLRRRMRAAELSRLLAPACPCRLQVGAIRAATRHGERYTDHIRVVSILAHLDRPNLVDVVVTFDVTHGGLVDRQGHRVRPETTARDLHREFIVRNIGGTWLIRQVLAV